MTDRYYGVIVDKKQSFNEDKKNQIFCLRLVSYVSNYQNDKIIVLFEKQTREDDCSHVITLIKTICEVEDASPLLANSEYYLNIELVCSQVLDELISSLEDKINQSDDAMLISCYVKVEKMLYDIRFKGYNKK